MADVNLRRKNLIYSKRTVELNLEVAYSHTKSVYLGYEADVVSDADVSEQGFRH